MRRKRRARHPNASGDRAPDACLPNPAKNQPNSESAIANHVALIISDCGRASFYECHSEFEPTALTQAFARLLLSLGRGSGRPCPDTITTHLFLQTPPVHLTFILRIILRTSNLRRRTQVSNTLTAPPLYVYRKPSRIASNPEQDLAQSSMLSLIIDGQPLLIQAVFCAVGSSLSPQTMTQTWVLSARIPTGDTAHTPLNFRVSHTELPNPNSERREAGPLAT